MRQLAQTIDWGVTVIDASIIIHRGKLEDVLNFDMDYLDFGWMDDEDPIV